MRILVVEDETKIANAIKKGLEQESYAVDVANTGNDGYDLASTEDYDLLILDIMLPDLNGMEIAKKLRNKKIEIPILMLTAKTLTQDKVNGLDSGADDYLTKPFSFDELMARVRALLRRPKSVMQTVLTFDTISLNSKTFEVKRAGKNIKLSLKEYALLEYLLRNPNQIQSKEKIISHVWNYDDDVLPNTVEVYVGYLRNKIDKPFPKLPPLIHTVRGFGYKIGT